MTRKLIPALLLLCVGSLHALNVGITHWEADASLAGEFNRSEYWYGDFSTSGALQLNNRYTFRSGLLIGGTKYHTDIKVFSGALIEPWARIQLGFSLAYMYNGLPQYEAHSHTILPVISFNARWAGIGIGTSFRFTSFFGDSALFESVLSFSAYVNFINNEKLRLGITIANFNDFSAGNMGSYTLGINSEIRLHRYWSLLCGLELKQSGSVGLASNFYGITWRGGAKFTW